jgi:hypothetical protein
MVRVGVGSRYGSATRPSRCATCSWRGPGRLRVRAGRAGLDALADVLAASTNVAFTDVVAAKVPGDRLPETAEYSNGMF